MSEPKKVDRRKFIYAGLGAVALIAIGAAAYVAMNPPVVTKTTTVPTTSVVTTTVPTTSVITTTSVVTTTPSEKVTLNVIHCWGGDEFKTFEPVLKEAESRLGINIKSMVIRTPDLAPMLDSLFPNNETPGDVITTWWPWAIKKWAKEGFLMDVSDIVSKEPFLQGVPGMAEVEGKTYGVPWTEKPFPIFAYRKSFFEKNGLTPPKDWNECVNLFEKLKSVPGVKAPVLCGDSGWPISLYSTFEAAIFTYGGYDLHHKLITGESKFTDSSVKTALETYFLPLLKYMGDPVDWVSGVDLWWKGEYPIFPIGAWIYVMGIDPNDVGFFFYPGQKSTMTSTDMWFVPKSTKHPNEAMALLKFLASRDAQELQVRQGGQWALRTDIPLEAYPDYAKPLAQALMQMKIDPPLDASISGAFSEKFERYMPLLKADPTKLDSILVELEKTARG